MSRKTNKPLVQVTVNRDGTILDPKKRRRFEKDLRKGVDRRREAVVQATDEAYRYARRHPAQTIAVSASALGLMAAGYLIGRQAS
jgi:ElaB/YqjD/DUF883 family membrane-anchored ribosome-binding protein